MATGSKSGFALKLLQWFVRIVQFCSAAIILALYSYFLATLHNHDLPISRDLKAVEGISGVAVVYTIFSIFLLCCLAGVPFFSFLAMVIDLAFVGAFIYVAVQNKGGASSCNGYLDTPYGDGFSQYTVSADSGFTHLPSFHTACRMESACLALAIISIIFFVISLGLEFALARNHQKEKRYGPSPANNYTSGSSSGGFMSRFRRNKKNKFQQDNNLPEHTHPGQLDGRQSYATDNTAVGNDAFHNGNKYEAGYGNTQPGVQPNY